jgi:intermembrane space import and assembly protein 40
MFSRLTRLPLRRCLHTRAAPPSYRNLRLTLGATAAVAATYLTWRLTANGHRIALDSVTRPPCKSHSFSAEVALKLLHVATTHPSTNLSDPAASSGPEITLPPNPQPEAESSSWSPDSDASKDDVPTGAPNPDDKEGASSDAGSGGGAFNPVTGEINWDCPCLGGMAHGPCGPQFREAFSCFVFSEEEPKGINCVEKFKAMQTCFREHPEIYGDGKCFLYFPFPCDFMKIDVLTLHQK